jgi:hypothetical protein
MSTQRRDVIQLNKAAVTRIMQMLGHTNYTLAKAMLVDPKQVRRWLEGSGRITIECAVCMANAMRCEVGHLTGTIPFHQIDLRQNSPAIGTPEYYAAPVEGKWKVDSRVAPGVDIHGKSMPEQLFQWEANFHVNGSSIHGEMVCRTPGFTHGQYDIYGEVNGRALIFLNGCRAIRDGVEDLFRALLRLHSVGRGKSISGGFAMYWAEYQEIFEGHVLLTPMGDMSLT